MCITRQSCSQRAPLWMSGLRPHHTQEKGGARCELFFLFIPPACAVFLRTNPKRHHPRVVVRPLRSRRNVSPGTVLMTDFRRWLRRPKNRSHAKTFFFFNGGSINKTRQDTPTMVVLSGFRCAVRVGLPMAISMATCACDLPYVCFAAMK